MSDFDVRLRRYTPGGKSGAILPAMEIQWTAPQSDIPSLTFKVSEAATGALPDLLEVAVEVWTEAEWVEPMNGRFFVLKSSMDDLDATGMKSCTGIAMASFILSNALLVNPEGVDRNVTGSVGGFLKAAFDEAAARGVGKVDGKAFMATTFDKEKDSAGKKWVESAWLSGITFGHGEKLTAILQILADQAFIEYSFKGRDLHVYNPGTGEDKSTGTGLVTVGNVSMELPVETSLEDLATHIIIRGEGGLSWEFKVPDAVTSLGRLEKTIDASGVETQAQAALIAELHQTTGSRPRKQYTVTETVAAMTAIPVADFNVGDWVSARRPGGWERMRVAQLQIRRTGENQAEVDIILADRLEDQATRIAKRNSAMGARRAGNGQMGRGHNHDYDWGEEDEVKQPGEIRIKLVDPRGGRMSELTNVAPVAACGNIAIGYTGNSFIADTSVVGAERGYFDIWTGRLEQGNLTSWGFRSRFTLSAAKMAELIGSSEWFYRLPPAVQDGDEPIKDGDGKLPEQAWGLSRLTVEFSESLTVIGSWLIIPFTVQGTRTHDDYEQFAVGGTRFLKAKIISEYEIGEVSFVQGGDVPTLTGGSVGQANIYIASDADGNTAVTVNYDDERRLYVSRFDESSGTFQYQQSQADIDEAEKLKADKEREEEEAKNAEPAEPDTEPKDPEAPPVVLEPDPELGEPDVPPEEDKDDFPSPVRPERTWKWLQFRYGTLPSAVAIGGSLDFRDEGGGLSIYASAAELQVDSELNPEPVGAEWIPLHQSRPVGFFQGGVVVHNHLVELTSGGAYLHVSNAPGVNSYVGLNSGSEIIPSPQVHDNFIYGFDRNSTRWVSFRIEEI